MNASYTMMEFADTSSPNEALAPFVINPNKTMDTRIKEVPTSKPRTNVPQMSMANLESAAYRSRSSTINMSAANSGSWYAEAPKVTHFAPKAKSRTSFLQMAAGTADDFVPDM